MPLGEAALSLLSVALRDPQVVTRYRDKIAAVPGSDCLYWCHAISGRGHGRFYVGTLPGGQGGRQRDLCMIAHRFGYALVYGSDALQQVPVLGHGCDNPLVRREALVDRVEVRDLRRRPVAAGRLKLGAA